MATDFQQEIKDLRTTMTSVREVTDLSALEAQISDLETQVAAPDLWDDQEKAQAVTSALSRAKAEHERVTGMDARVDDLEALVEMGQEENDAETLAEAEKEPRQGQEGRRRASRSAPCSAVSGTSARPS